MGSWPEFEDERLTGALLRVDLYENRYLAVNEYHNVINHLLRSASAACLLDHEPDALALIARAGRRMSEWIAAVGAGRVKQGFYADFAATRGLLALALLPDEARDLAAEDATTFLAQTVDAPSGPVYNARLAAAALRGDFDTLRQSARSCELSDAGLGLPWRRFATTLEAHDAAALGKLATTWIREKEEATQTSEWGAYDEVPIEVSGALGVAALLGVDVRVTSNRVLTRFRA